MVLGDARGCYLKNYWCPTNPSFYHMNELKLGHSSTASSTISAAHNQRLSTQRGAGVKPFGSDIYLPILCPSSTFSHTVYLAETHSNSSYIPRLQGDGASFKALGPGVIFICEETTLCPITTSPSHIPAYYTAPPLLPFFYHQKSVSREVGSNSYCSTS